MRVDVYIRKENYKKWDAIANKSAWLNAILSHADDTGQWGESKDLPGVGDSTVVLTERLPEEELPRHCPHGALWTYCRQGCAGMVK